MADKPSLLVYMYTIIGKAYLHPAMQGGLWRLSNALFKRAGQSDLQPFLGWSLSDEVAAILSQHRIGERRPPKQREAAADAQSGEAVVGDGQRMGVGTVAAQYQEAVPDRLMHGLSSGSPNGASSTVFEPPGLKEHSPISKILCHGGGRVDCVVYMYSVLLNSG